MIGLSGCLADVLIQHGEQITATNLSYYSRLCLLSYGRRGTAAIHRLHARWPPDNLGLLSWLVLVDG